MVIPAGVETARVHSSVGEKDHLADQRQRLRLLKQMSSPVSSPTGHFDVSAEKNPIWLEVKSLTADVKLSVRMLSGQILPESWN